jgi:hypothetical protein
MALNRMVASIEDSQIASLAEHAVERHSGKFDEALSEVINAGFEAIKASDTVQAALLGAAYAPVL